MTIQEAIDVVYETIPEKMDYYKGKFLPTAKHGQTGYMEQSECVLVIEIWQKTFLSMRYYCEDDFSFDLMDENGCETFDVSKMDDPDEWKFKVLTCFNILSSKPNPLL